MRAAPAEHVHVQPVRLRQQQVRLAGHEGEALEEADPDAAVGDDLCERQGRGFHVVPALDDFEVWRDGPEVFVGLLVGEVAQGEGLADFAGGEEFFELYAFVWF